MNDAKTEILRVRMTPMEKAALSRQANDQHKTMSEYIRSIAKCPPEVTRDEFDGSILQMIYEINKIGVNINQIAKKYNEHNYVEPRADLYTGQHLSQPQYAKIAGQTASFWRYPQAKSKGLGRGWVPVTVMVN